MFTSKSKSYSVSTLLLIFIVLGCKAPSSQDSIVVQEFGDIVLGDITTAIRSYASAKGTTPVQPNEIYLFNPKIKSYLERQGYRTRWKVLSKRKVVVGEEWRVSLDLSYESTKLNGRELSIIVGQPDKIWSVSYIEDAQGKQHLYESIDNYADCIANAAFYFRETNRHWPRTIDELSRELEDDKLVLQNYDWLFENNNDKDYPLKLSSKRARVVRLYPSDGADINERPVLIIK